MNTSTAGEQDDDIRFGFNAHALHLDIYSLKDTTVAATIQNLIDKVTRVKLVTQNGTPETSIDSDDLHDFAVKALGKVPYHSVLTSTDNIPHAIALGIPLSPFPEDPLKNFGMPAGQGIQLIQEQAADVSQDFNGYVYDLTVDGVDTADKGSSNGYLRFFTDSYTSGAVGEIHDTVVAPAKRILGVMNFQTTSYDDLAAAAANDVTGIRTQALAFSESIQFESRPMREGAFQPNQTVATFAAAAAGINVLDSGRFWNDYGLRNAGTRLGIGWKQNSKIKTTAGVAEATRVIPVTLV
jgi:hypothetical protein